MNIPTETKSLPAIQFEPDGYVLDGPKLMGRQAAGHGFLRAAITAAAQLEPPSLVAWTMHRSSAQVFARLVNQQAPAVKAAWLTPDKLSALSGLGGLYMPGPSLAQAAAYRLRAGSAAYYLTGVTHTLASANAMQSIASMLEAPVMPWDALICTSSVAKKVVENILHAQAEYLSWRLGAKNFTFPLLPVIPLGVHQQDFFFTDAERAAARDRLAITGDTIAVLFSGRLSFHAKAHPYPMFVALQNAAVRSGKPVHLLLCGQFPSDAVKLAFLSGANKYAPQVAVSVVDGKDFDAYQSAWAASDLFISLSDNLQETFGITPLEAMASGLPVVVSDWDGYKDTVADGETGFRIPTWMPSPGSDSKLAAAFEGGMINYDYYIGLASLEVGLDNQLLTDRLTTLFLEPELRKKMGAAGRQRVAQKFDWGVVIQQYQALWMEQAQRRQAGFNERAELLVKAPTCSPVAQDPCRVFASFPTRQIRPDTLVSPAQPEWRQTSFVTIRNDPLFSFAAERLPTEDEVSKIMTRLSNSPMTLDVLSKSVELPLPDLIRKIAFLNKIGMVLIHSS